MKVKKLAHVISLICIAGPVAAQQTPPPQPQKIEKVEITGSSIKRVQDEGALPLQIITKEDIDRAGIVSAEQLLATIAKVLGWILTGAATVKAQHQSGSFPCAPVYPGAHAKRPPVTGKPSRLLATPWSAIDQTSLVRTPLRAGQLLLPV